MYRPWPASLITGANFWTFIWCCRVPPFNTFHWYFFPEQHWIIKHLCLSGYQRESPGLYKDHRIRDTDLPSPSKWALRTRKASASRKGSPFPVDNTLENRKQNTAWKLFSYPHARQAWISRAARWTGTGTLPERQRDSKPELLLYDKMVHPLGVQLQNPNSIIFMK